MRRITTVIPLSARRVTQLVRRELVEQRCSGLLALQQQASFLRQRTSFDSFNDIAPHCFLQCRLFAARGEYSKLRPKKKKQDPFKDLDFQLSKDETVAYTAVKRKFLQIAMEHHPDTAQSETDNELEEHKRIFMQARNAFELLVEAPDGSAILREDSDQWQDDDFNAWFQEETGHDMPYMDAQTMKEVAEMTETVGGGLDRDGGMWTLARMVSASVKNGGDGRDMLRLEAGETRSRDLNGILRRKRKR
ncbi:hypothetical protein MPSEU_000032200 [Mayamaea pseudoterrestris]|nr:hypothetical protein MPSEU_000032200 [Mayamaea pseudoterrestris]